MRRLLLILSVCLAACSSDEARFGRFQERDEQVLYFNNFEEPEFLDPALLTGHPDSFIATQLFEGLTSPHPKTLVPRPALATHWEVSNEGKTYRFHLRKDAKWSDGSMLTAHDFVYSVERALRPSTAARYAYQLYPIAFAKEYNGGRVARVAVSGAHASREPYVLATKQTRDESAFSPFAFGENARVRLLDSNLRVAKEDTIELRAEPEQSAAPVSRLGQKPALVLAARDVERQGVVERWWQVRPPLGDAAGWARDSDLRAVMPSLSHRLIDTDADQTAVRVEPKENATVRLRLDDESEVELLESGEKFSLVRDALSQKSGYVNNDELDDITGDRNWVYVEATDPISGEAERGWLSTRVLRSDAEVLGIKAEDKHTLRVDLVEPTPYFLSLTFFSAMLPVPKQAIHAHGARWTKPENIVTSGAFTLTTHRPRDHMELRRSKTYFDVDKVKLQRVVVFSVADVHTNINLFRSGYLDAMHSAKLPVELVPGLSQKVDYVSGAYLASYFIRLNNNKKPLDDIRVRQALNLAIDKKMLTEKLLRGGQTTATHIVPPGLPGYPVVEGAGTDVEKARALMAEAGFKDGKGFPKLGFLYNTSDEHRLVAEYLQRAWKDALGIDILLQNQEWKTFLQKMHAQDYDLSRSGWIGDYTDPNTFLDMWVKDGGNNETGYANPEYDKRIQGAKEESNVQARMQLFAEAEAMLNRDVPFIPLYYYVNNFLMAPEVEGYYANLIDHHALKDVWINRDKKPERKVESP